jgi:hypothetical protein
MEKRKDETLEGWKIGRPEYWNSGRVEEWNTGRLPRFPMTGSTPANNENPPLPPFNKGGLGGFESHFLTNEKGLPSGEFLVDIFQDQTQRLGKARDIGVGEGF